MSVHLAVQHKLTVTLAPVGTLLSLKLAEKLLSVAPDLHCSFSPNMLCSSKGISYRPRYAHLCCPAGYNPAFVQSNPVAFIYLRFSAKHDHIALEPVGSARARYPSNALVALLLCTPFEPATRGPR